MIEPQPGLHATWITFEDRLGRSVAAPVPLRCECCGSTIQPGEPFRRLRVESRTYERLPFCSTCRPAMPADA